MTVRKHYLTWLFWVAVACIGLPHTSRSDEVVDLGGFIDDPESLDEVDQRTPLKTAQGFMRFAELGDYEGAAEFLDLRYLPDSLENVDGSALAEQLYVIISRKLPIDFASLSDQPAGAENDGLPSYRDELGVIETSQGGFQSICSWFPVRTIAVYGRFRMPVSRGFRIFIRTLATAPL